MRFGVWCAGVQHAAALGPCRQAVPGDALLLLLANAHILHPLRVRRLALGLAARVQVDEVQAKLRSDWPIDARLLLALFLVAEDNIVDLGRQLPRSSREKEAPRRAPGSAPVLVWGGTRSRAAAGEKRWA